MKYVRIFKARCQVTRLTRANVEAEFLCEDARRQQRHYIFAVFGFVALYKISTMLASVMTWQMWLLHHGVAALILIISRVAASQPAAMWVDFVFAIFSFFMILYTSRVYENLISQKLLPTDATEVDLLCAFVFNSQVMVSMGNHPAVHVAWILAALSACWTTTNPHLQVDIKIVLVVGFSMHAFTHHSQMRLRERRLEWEGELRRIRKREARALFRFQLATIGKH